MRGQIRQQQIDRLGAFGVTAAQHLFLAPGSWIAGTKEAPVPSARTVQPVSSRAVPVTSACV